MRFNRLGLAFDYPDNWSVEIDDTSADNPAVTVTSPDGGFWSVSGQPPGTPAARLTEAVVRQMQSEYRDMDSEAASDLVAGRQLAGWDLNFYCLDLTNTAQVRAVETPAATYLLLAQAEDREWDRVAPVFGAMTASFMAGLPSAARGRRAPAAE